MRVRGLCTSAPRRWGALSASRLSRIRRKQARDDAPPKRHLQRSVLDALLLSALHPPRRGVPCALNLLRSSLSRHPCVLPSPATQARIISASARAVARCDPPLAALASGGADAAVEAMFRLAHLTRARTPVSALCAVVQAAALDPVLERRSARVWSIWRYLNSQQHVATPPFVYASFRVCAQSLDVQSAALLLQHALQHNMLHNAPLQLDYYNHLMHAACLSAHYHLLATAHAEMLRYQLRPDAFTHSILLTAALDQHHHTNAQIILNSMQSANRQLYPCVYAAMIRSAARHGDASAVHQIHTEYERTQPNVSQTLSPQAIATHSSLSIARTARACAQARDDPTLAAFHAYRSCTAADHAVQLLDHLVRRVRIRPSQLVYSLVLETCWKAGRMQLAKQLRADMQANVLSA